MAKILKDKRAGVYFNLIAAFFCVIAMIGYAFAGQDSYGFVPLVEVFLALGIISAAISSWRDFFGFGPVVTMAFFAAGFGVFLNSRFMYYSHQYYKIASDPISVSMIITTIGMIGMLFFELISAFMSWEKER